jgi:hypothetical protein
MRRHLRALAIACLSLLLAGAAMAQNKCDLTDRSAMVGLSAAEFFALPAGSLAIGESCDPRVRTCTRYLDISGCQKVDYAISASGSPGQINFSVNPVVKCEQDCDLLDSFLAVALTFPHGPAIGPDIRFVDLTRNKSDRWAQMGGGALSQQSCCEGATSPTIFSQSHGPGTSTPDEFKRLTGMSWHSAFSLKGRGKIVTFDHRDFFVGALNACGDCSMKAYLLRFLEITSGQADAKPSTPLFFSAKVLTFNQINLEVTAPFGNEAYDQSMVINIIR